MIMQKILYPGLFLLFVLIAMIFLPGTPLGFTPPDNLANLGIETNSFIAAFPFAFGGPILAVDECTCSGGWRIVVGPPRPMDLLYQPGISILFPFYNIFVPSTFVLGTYVPGGFCSRGTTACTGLPVLGTITMVGTSI